jgi:predicted nucleic acid-binding protein
LIYLDTSALVKRYVWESGSIAVRRLFQGNGPLATSKIAYTEAYGAFTRRFREGHLSQGDHTQVCGFFETEWPAYVTVDVSDEVLHLSRDLIRRYVLRAFDALHLASAKFLSRSLNLPAAFVCADRRLLRCAKAEGFAIQSV